MPLIAMASLAEMAVFETMAFLTLGNVFIAVMAIFVVVKRTQRAAFICCGLWILEMGCLAPWSGFVFQLTGDSDWDQHQGRFRSIAGWWVAVSMVFGFAVIAVLFDRYLIWPRKIEPRRSRNH